MTAKEAVPTVRRGRGNSAGLTPQRIVAAARDFDPDTLTIQAVADQLGVDRKAVHYHVTDREGLLELLAVDAFSSRFLATVPEEGSNWVEALRAIAVSTKDALLLTGSLVTYFALRGPADQGMIEPAEVALEKMIEAGFDERDAGRALTLVISTAMAFARDMVVNQQAGGHPQEPELRQALDQSDSSRFRALRHLDSVGFTAYDEERFAFDLDILLRGLEHRLAATLAATPA